MGDLGSDVGGSSLSLMAKVMESLMKLLEKVFETWKSAPQRKKAALEYKLAKEENERRELIKAVEGSVGMIAYDKLKKSGEVTTLYDIPMTREEMQEFADICKRRGIHFAGVTVDTKGNHADVLKEERFLGRTKDLVMGSATNERRSYFIAFRRSDAEQIKDVVDLLNKEKLMRQNDANIKALMEKGEENWTPEDRAMYEEYRKMNKEVQKEYCDQLNDEQGAAIVEKVVTGKTDRGMSLEEALNRNTGRSLDKDEYTIVADAKDPSKHIRCHGYQDSFHGKSYIKTIYSVYHGDKKVFETHDGRFDGRPEGYWKEQLSTIHEALGGSGTVLKFQNIADYQKWTEELAAQNAKELDVLTQNGVTRDYDQITQTLTKQLEEIVADYKDGVVVDRYTGKVLVIRDEMPEEERTMVAEAICIGKQLDNYQNMKLLEEELTLEKTEVLIAEGNPDAKALAEQRLAKLQEKYELAKKRERELTEERQSINAVQSEQEVSKQPIRVKREELEYLPEDRVKIDALTAEIEKLETEKGKWTGNSEELARLTAKIESMKGDLEMMKAEAEKNAGAAEKPDDRKAERVNDPKQFEMEEVRKEIKARREERAAGAETKDHPMNKTPKENGDRTDR